MKLMVSGTRKGMTDQQRQSFRLFLERNRENIEELIHGDCIGVDAEAHDIFCEVFGISFAPGYLTKPSKPLVVIFPGREKYHTQRAMKLGHIIMPVDTPLVRNNNMVNRADYLIAMPDTARERIRSGTWQSVRSARAKRVPNMVIPPGERKAEVKK